MSEMSRVVMFEENDPIWLELAAEGAAEAGWRVDPYMSAQSALEALDPTAGALITGLGFAVPLGGVHPARTLIERSNELDIPRALLSGHPGAGRFVRRGSFDIVIPKEAGIEVPSLVSNWLIRLSNATF